MFYQQVIWAVSVIELMSAIIGNVMLFKTKRTITCNHLIINDCIFFRYCCIFTLNSLLLFSNAIRAACFKDACNFLIRVFYKQLKVYRGTAFFFAKVRDLQIHYS